MSKTSKFYIEVDPQRSVLLLDRDGVINQRIVNDYVKSWQSFVFIPGALNALSVLSKIYYGIAIVTNQQCVSKGLLSKEDLQHIHHAMVQEIQSAGGHIHAIYAATELASDHPVYRKPGMGWKAAIIKDFPGVDFSLSTMVGDSDSDIAFGNALGCTTVGIGKNLTQNMADFHVNSLESLLSKYAIDVH